MTYAVEPVVQPLAAVHGAVVPPHGPVTVSQAPVSQAAFWKFTVVNAVLLVQYAASLYANRPGRGTSKNYQNNTILDTFCPGFFLKKTKNPDKKPGISRLNRKHKKNIKNTIYSDGFFGPDRAPCSILKTQILYGFYFIHGDILLETSYDAESNIFVQYWRVLPCRRDYNTVVPNLFLFYAPILIFKNLKPNLTAPFKRPFVFFFF